MRENKKVEKMLSSNTKQVEEATGALSRLFRQILLDVNLSKMRWSSLMEQYIKDPRNRINQVSKDISSARGNLAKELVRPDMTWKVFNKAIRFLNPRSVKIGISIEWHRGRTTIHEVQIYKSLSSVGEKRMVYKDALGEIEKQNEKMIQNSGSGATANPFMDANHQSDLKRNLQALKDYQDQVDKESDQKD